ncbi:polysaccharide deacetylase family protein [Ammoniphilus sp. CFH 90114]|uniref:polysaccharide deacetylase family protein n=1 Tax=Ammoniphilus sp. CFH 90114 TaxID=2493665 RepID=UPI0013E937E3|nr:polysaccharide deacetylase family protein [Ammoniphilus sp. CFH 90114]
MKKSNRLACLIWLLCMVFVISCSTNTQVPVEPPVKTPIQTQPTAPVASTPVEETEPSDVSEEPLEPAQDPEAKAKYHVDTKHFMIHSSEESNNQKIALLTFDDGPKGQVTMKILDTLDKYNAKSIWFVNGFNYGWDYKPSPQKEQQFNSLIQEIHNRGHIVANHTWEHGNLRKQSPEKQRKEITSMNELLENITGEKPRYFRPPFGAYSDIQKQVMKEENMQWMNWSVGSLDWEYKDPEKVVDQVLSNMHNGANILMHDFPVTAEALDPLLKELTEQGYHFVLPTEVRID